MNKPSVLDEAQMRQEFRRLYREVGREGCLQIIYEFVIGANLLAGIILEEENNGQH